MPVVILHELAHAFHDQVLGFDNAELVGLYRDAKAGGSYDKVERFRGPGRGTSVERAYAMTTPQEYFAEGTEAYFLRNDLRHSTGMPSARWTRAYLHLLKRFGRRREFILVVLWNAQHAQSAFQLCSFVCGFSDCWMSLASS